MEYLREDENNEAQKILFTGLDTAGKTSIIMALKREFSKIAILAPTRGAQRRIFEFLGRDISEWDLGGQKSYRISYLKNPGKYFDNTAIAIYVIDIQNKQRIDEAILYLKDVIEQFQELEIQPPIYVFFHKFDPVLARLAKNELNTLIVNLKDRIKREADYDNIYYYKTSIYNLPSITKAMSEILLSLYPKTELIEKTIKQFADKINSEGVVVIDDNSLLIGSYYKNEEIKKILTASTPYFLTLNDSFKRTEGLDEGEGNHVLVQRFGRYLIFKQIMLKASSPPYYLIIVKNKPEFEKEEIDSLANLLKQVLYK